MFVWTVNSDLPRLDFLWKQEYLQNSSRWEELSIVQEDKKPDRGVEMPKLKLLSPPLPCSPWGYSYSINLFSHQKVHLLLKKKSKSLFTTFRHQFPGLVSSTQTSPSSSSFMHSLHVLKPCSNQMSTSEVIILKTAAITDLFLVSWRHWDC